MMLRRLLAPLLLGCCFAPGAASADGWKAGTARAAITPEKPVWMAGYASRTRPADGKIHDLWAKALVLEDAHGHRSVLITLDLCGIGHDLSNRVRDEIQKQGKLERSGVVLACSHTHSGPVVGDNLITMYKIGEEQRKQVVEYTEALAGKLVAIAAEATKALAPAEVSWGTGRADFATNRRENKEPEVPKLRDGLALKGPNDHDVPVLSVKGADGKQLAVVFGYACHCTTLDGYQWCGDYAGFAQAAIEEAHPGATALFVAGCGGDQNPLPRRKVEYALSYGNALAESVGKVLASGTKPLAKAELEARYEEVPLAFAEVPDKAHWEEMAKSDSFYESSRAKALLERIARDGSLPKSYPYPVQAWKLGGELTWVFLGGEVVVDYSLRIKRNLGSSKTWVSGYCNDVMAYIPSLRILKEGGYEGGGAMVYYAQPAHWSDQVEEQILEAVGRLTRKP